jgi:hypothetical protein
MVGIAGHGSRHHISVHLLHAFHHLSLKLRVPLHLRHVLMLRRGLAILCCPRCGTDAVVLSPWVPVQDKDGNQVAMWIIKLECPDCLLFRPMPISTRWEAVMKAPEIVRLTL